MTYPGRFPDLDVDSFDAFVDAPHEGLLPDWNETRAMLDKCDIQDYLESTAQGTGQTAEIYRDVYRK